MCTVPSAFSVSPCLSRTTVPAGAFTASCVHPAIVRPMSATNTPGFGELTTGVTDSTTRIGSCSWAFSVPFGAGRLGVDRHRESSKPGLVQPAGTSRAS